MNHIIKVLLIIFSGLFLTGCETVQPLSDVDRSLYQVFHESTHYTILKRIVTVDVIISEEGIVIRSNRMTTCTVFQDVTENFIVLYHDAYYDIVSAAELDLFKGQDLIQLQMNVTCT